jgi:hypothetical protein
MPAGGMIAAVKKRTSARPDAQFCYHRLSQARGDAKGRKQWRAEDNDPGIVSPIACATLRLMAP